jgi:putative membrane protein
MKRWGTLAVACAAALTMNVTNARAQSAGQGGPPAGSPGSTVPSPVATPPPDRPDTGKAPQSDAQKFFEKAAIANMAEIRLGQLATQRAESPDVKQFGQMMVDEHTKALDQLKEAAQKANITLPTDIDSKHQKKQDKLSQASGAEFDKKYMDAMVDAHKDVAKMLKDESKKAAGAVGTSGSSTSTTATGTSGANGGTQGAAGTSGATVETATAPAAEWAAATLPGVEQHLDRAKQIQESLKASDKNSPSNAPTTTTPGATTPGSPQPGSDTNPPSGTNAPPTPQPHP